MRRTTPPEGLRADAVRFAVVRREELVGLEVSVNIGDILRFYGRDLKIADVTHP